ncbi:hypothetical protein OAO87_02145 [bacterium]|nr:hypothetical protein [bacterium]
MAPSIVTHSMQTLDTTAPVLRRSLQCAEEASLDVENKSHEGGSRCATVRSAYPAAPNEHAPPPLLPAKPGSFDWRCSAVRCHRAHDCTLRRPLTFALCVRAGVARAAAGASRQGPAAKPAARRAGTEEND